jgi:hypothetical protein
MVLSCIAIAFCWHFLDYHDKHYAVLNGLHLFAVESTLVVCLAPINYGCLLGSFVLGPYDLNCYVHHVLTIELHSICGHFEQPLFHGVLIVQSYDIFIPQL